MTGRHTANDVVLPRKGDDDADRIGWSGPYGRQYVAPLAARWSHRGRLRTTRGDGERAGRRQGDLGRSEIPQGPDRPAPCATGRMADGAGRLYPRHNGRSRAAA